MDTSIIVIVSFVAAGLTLVSGFGLGTILMPAFALFFPIDIAIALTAIVHLLNNVFKFQLFRKEIDLQIVLKFGLPAIVASYFGASMLFYLSSMKPVYTYSISGSLFHIHPVKLVIGMLLNIFALIEVVPMFNKMTFDKKYLPFGGILSGFFGGLSGHQGALRSAFLLKTGLSKGSFIGTGVAIACMIDIIRLIKYGTESLAAAVENNFTLLFLTIAAAFCGSFLGAKLIKKITIHSFQISVAVMLFIIANLMIFGII